MEKYKSLKEGLTDLGWFLIENKLSDFTEILEIFRPNELDSDGTPKIVTKNKTVIVLDNRDWNETYLLDIVSEELKKFNSSIKPGTYDLVYINDVCCRELIEYGKCVREKNNDFERNFLHPMVIVINPQKTCIVSVKEHILAVINNQGVSNVIKYLDDDFCESQM